MGYRLPVPVPMQQILVRPAKMLKTVHRGSLGSLGSLGKEMQAPSLLRDSEIDRLVSALSTSSLRSLPPTTPRVSLRHTLTEAQRRAVRTLVHSSVLSIYHRLTQRASLPADAVEHYRAIVHSTSTRPLVSRFNIDLSPRELQCLAPRQWLNDEVINVYFQILAGENARFQADPRSSGSVPRIAVFNSFFYSRLCSQGYSAVQRWTRRWKRPLLDLDTVLFPINVGNTHWTLGVIDVAESTVSYLDSMGGRDAAFGTTLQSYLNAVANDMGRPRRSWRVTYPRVPQQSNGFDCGVFVCAMAHSLSLGLAPAITQAEMPAMRQRILLASLRTP